MKVISLHASPERGFPRLSVDSVELLAGHGVRGDRKAGKRENRAVLLMGQATYDHLQSIGMLLPYGALGENLVFDFDPHDLEPGTLLEVGGAVVGPASDPQRRFEKTVLAVEPHSPGR